ncbi:hypothetical protein OGAPHI_006650 [Ogataea philodendri]|uniref:Uncharacterized protein n=1 Tax=Ogataea philodendri TaxID=1378263 RepID=A0A9P8NWN8_9ASCO|nr:uncharacterized protein OGAPHI_006650 [Ogataea philodendri]KAH3661243.1 hypothetical protein OGAPHI_006650 [Ogataea philodendri]
MMDRYPKAAGYATEISSRSSRSLYNWSIKPPESSFNFCKALSRSASASSTRFLASRASSMAFRAISSVLYEEINLLIDMFMSVSSSPEAIVIFETKVSINLRFLFT